ncbi:MAG: hypothetical protein ACM3XN_02945 [Chloroflexota bacterium]
MSLKSIDMVTMVPRLTDVSRAQQVKEQEGQIAQQQFATQLQTEAAQAQHQVNLPAETAKVQAGRDGGNRRGRQSGAGRGQKGEGETSNERRPAAAGEKGSVIDIILGGAA